MQVEIKSNASEVKRCHRCDLPLAKVDADGTIRIIKYHRGKPVEVRIGVRHTRGGVVSIACERCKGKATPLYFITLVHPTYVQGKHELAKSI